MKTTMNFRLGFATLAASLVFASGLAADDVKAAPKTVSIDASRLAPDLLPVATLLGAGIDDKVILNYIGNTPLRRSPTAEELIYLRDLGLSTDAILALLKSAPKVSVAQETPKPAPPLETRLAQTAPSSQQQQYVQSPAPASSPDLVAASRPPATAVITSQPPPVAYTRPAPQVVYTQSAPTTVYVEAPPAVTYVPSYPRFSIGLGLGHLFGHHDDGHYYGGHYGGGHYGGGHYGGGHSGGGHSGGGH